MSRNDLDDGPRESGAGAPSRAPAVDVVDALVVGSGFGASVAAYRLAQAGRSVVVMERGREYAPGQFARTPAELGRAFWDPSEGLYGMFDPWTFEGLEGLVSSGLGGGSLIYANVLLRKDEAWFVTESPIPGGGYETWPITRADLDPHYDAVEAMIRPTRYPYEDTPKTQAMEAAAHSLGLAVQRPPLAVRFGLPGRGPTPSAAIPEPDYGNYHRRPRVTCTLCGECDIGCNTGAKETLDHNYLSAAAFHGADIRTRHEVRGIRALAGGGYEVRYCVHTADQSEGTSTATRSLPVHTIRCTKLILGAGTFGTTYLLLRNRASLPALSAALGTRFSGNGDLLSFLVGAQRDGQPVTINGSRGPVITTAIRVPDEVDGTGAAGRGFYIEDAGFPEFANWIVEAANLGSVARRAGSVAWRIMLNRMWSRQGRSLSKDLASALGSGALSAGSLPLLGMGRDVPDGRMRLSGGYLGIDWTVTTSQAYFARVQATMADIAKEFGAEFRDNPLWWANRVITVHPLGGAPLGRHRGEGLCDPFGEVFGHPGLYVLDGAAMPGPVGANPALTIAAMSDRACTRILEQPWPAATTGPIASSPLVEPEPATTGPAALVSPTVRSVRFTEKMRGYVAAGQADPQRGGDVARSRGDKLMFELTIATPDIEEFVADPLHRASAAGYVDGAVVGGRVEVGRGWFNLFVHPQGSPSRRMLYRLWVTTAGGTDLTLVGYKDVTDGPGVDVWTDTTTLYVHLLDGHVPPPAATTDTQVARLVADLGGDQTAGGTVLAAGLLVIKPWDFAEQLTTFRSSGPRAVTAIAAFGRLFLGELWDAYAAGKLEGRTGRTGQG